MRTLKPTARFLPPTRVILGALVAILTLAGTGCNERTASPMGRNTLQRVIAKKEIRAAYIVYPPTVSVESDTAKPTGFLIEIMDEIAKRGNFTVKYESITFDDLKLAVAKYDIVVAGVFVNVPRSRDMALTSPIMFWAGVTAIGSSDTSKKFASLEEINKPEIRVAVTQGTAEHDFVRQQLPKATINPIPNSEIALTLAEVTAGRADVAFADAVTIRKFLQNKPGLALMFGGQQFTTFATSFAVKVGDIEWLNFLNSSLLSLHADGTIRALDKKYGGHELWALPKVPWEDR
jgi:polar amino acid transport system substrate-binding protein